MARTEEHHSMATDKGTNSNASQKQIPRLRIDTAISTQTRNPTTTSLTVSNLNGASSAGQGISRLDILAAAAESKRDSQFRTVEGFKLANKTDEAEPQPSAPDTVDEEIQPTPPDSAGEQFHLPAIHNITSLLPGSGSPSSPISISSSPSSTPAPAPASTSILPPTWKPTPNNDISLTTALDNPITYKISLPPPRPSAHLTCGTGCGRKYAVLPTGFGGLGLARGEGEDHRDELFWRAGFVGWEETLDMAKYWRGKQERENGDEEAVRDVEDWKRRHCDKWHGRD